MRARALSRAASVRCSGALVLAAALPRAAVAQVEPPSSFDVNVPYAHYYGTGVYRFRNERVFALSLRAEPSLRAFGPQRVGIVMRISGLAAWQQVEVADTSRVTVRILSFVPGLGLDIPLGRWVVLRPFVDAGGVRDVNRDRWLALGTIGTGLEWVRAWRRFEIGVVPVVGYSRTFAGDPQADDDLFLAGVTLDARRRAGFRVLGEEADVGAYVLLGGFWGDTDLSADRGQTVEIGRQFELGLSIGTYPRPKIWLFRLPRLWLGLRFGNDFTGLRISFGERRLRYPPPN